MTIAFRLLLIFCAIGALAYILRKIRTSQLHISDSTFWFLFAAVLVIMAIFPETVFFFCDLLGIESPPNFVFLCVIAVLMVRVFISTVEISQLRTRVATLAQEDALSRASGEVEGEAPASKSTAE